MVFISFYTYHSVDEITWNKGMLMFFIDWLVNHSFLDFGVMTRVILFWPRVSVGYKVIRVMTWNPVFSLLVVFNYSLQNGCKVSAYWQLWSLYFLFNVSLFSCTLFLLPLSKYMNLYTYDGRRDFFILYEIYFWQLG